ncbi:hypothetical protein BD414DRAFT_576864 [Trametes punicea]|nr:hypothetical protein BD414DRAFT_576864 [Trametes punicea]
MSDSLAPLISGVLLDLPALIERTLRHETACQALVAQCSDLAAYVEAAMARIAHEKAAQRRLRAEVAAFLRERGELRSANSSRVIEDSLMVSDVSVNEQDQGYSYLNLRIEHDASLDLESPLSLKSKRKGGAFSDGAQVALRRRRLTVNGTGPSNSAE